jgi:hypothetical protein
MYVDLVHFDNPSIPPSLSLSHGRKDSLLLSLREWRSKAELVKDGSFALHGYPRFAISMNETQFNTNNS